MSLCIVVTKVTKRITNDKQEPFFVIEAYLPSVDDTPGEDRTFYVWNKMPAYVQLTPQIAGS